MRKRSSAPWQRDDFRYGFLQGKLATLAWVSGEKSFEMNAHFTYEDWLLEVKSQHDELKPFGEEELLSE